MFWMLCAFFWVIPQRLNVICRRFGILFRLHRRVGMKNDSSYLSAYEDGTQCSDASAYKIQTLRSYTEKIYNIECIYVIFEVTDATILLVFRRVRKIVKSDYCSSTAEMFAWTSLNGTLYVHHLCCYKHCISDTVHWLTDSDLYVAPSFMRCHGT